MVVTEIISHLLYENPLIIIQDILKGCKNDKKIVVEENRELALRKALAEIQHTRDGGGA